MVDIVRAWKADAKGLFIEMRVGAVKNYAVVWDEFVSVNEGDALNVTTWTLPAGLTKISEANEGDVAAVTIQADTAGTYDCTHTMTTTNGIKEVIPFRVQVSA